MMMNNPAHAGELISEWLDGLKEEGQAITSAFNGFFTLHVHCSIIVLKFS